MNLVKVGFAGAEPYFVNGCFGSLADLFTDITPMSGIGGKAAPGNAGSARLALSVRFHQERTFDSLIYRRFEGLLTATSRRLQRTDYE